MKHGTVRNGRTVTMYGRDANNWLIQRSCELVNTIEEATSKIRSFAPGPLQNAAIAYFDGLYLEDKKGKRVKFDPTDLIAEIEKEEEERRAEARERWRQETITKLKAAKTSTARSTLKVACFVSGKTINKGDVYHRVGKYRALADCL